MKTLSLGCAANVEPNLKLFNAMPFIALTFTSFGKYSK